MRPQEVPEGDGHQPSLAVALHHVDMVRSRIALYEVVTTRNPVLTSVAVPDALHGPDTNGRSFEILDTDQDVENRLGGDTGHGRTTHMLDVEDVPTNGFENSPFLELKLLRPGPVSVQKSNPTFRQS